MSNQVDEAYYISRASQLSAGFKKAYLQWEPFILSQYGEDFSKTIEKEAQAEFEILIPQIPYIGGDENHLTYSLIGSVRYLALYKAMKKHRRTPEETGKILYDAIMARIDEAQTPVPPSQLLTEEELMARRRERAERTQKRRYPDDYVYAFVAGDGETFDYGYDFVECAAHKFYQAQHADEFMPYYCFLDYPKSKVHRIGLERTMMLPKGCNKCDHRFKKGRSTELTWPPPFLNNR